MTELPQVPGPRCMYLQSKAMAVYGEAFENDEDYQAGVADFWCVQSGRAIGPDEDAVGLKECCDPNRGCHQEY